MLRTFNNEFAPTTVCDTVRIKFAEVDPGQIDTRNLLAVVISVEDSDFYRLGNKNGTYKQLFTRNHS